MKSICKICGQEFSNILNVNGKKIHSNGRALCWQCSPYIPRAERKQKNTNSSVKQCFDKPQKGLCRICKQEFKSKKGSQRCGRCCQRFKNFKIKIWIAEWFNNECSECGRECDMNNIRAFDCHHISPSSKSFSLSKSCMHSYAAIEDEIKKCVFLCAYCHRLRHNNEVDTLFVESIPWIKSKYPFSKKN